MFIIYNYIYSTLLLLIQKLIILEHVTYECRFRVTKYVLWY